MAERRMFAKTIVLSDAFLDMPLSTRCLYFTLGMVADDDGFVNNPKSIMRQCGASLDDLNLLLAKKFIIGFDNGIIVIKHWRLHNYIQKDRYIPTKYSEQKEMLSIDSNNSYTLDSSLIEEIVGEPISDARKKRIEEYKNSDLPYSFSYKIRNAFIGKECPICNRLMGVPVRDSDDPIVSRTPMPTIQHNIPISKGGKHSLDNISVICSECNHSVQDNPTDSLNNGLVVEIWSEIQECDGNVYTGKVSIDKDSINNNTLSGKPDPADVKEIIDYFNKVCGTRYQASSKATSKHITARLKEGFTVEDFKKVIDKKYKQWSKEPKMAEYLRPITLFGTKFESYLNQPDTLPKGKNHDFSERKYDYDALMKEIVT